MTKHAPSIPDELVLPFSGHRHTEDPIVIDRGEGAYLYSVDGRRFYDGNSSLWVANLGHGHATVTAAIRKQLDKIAHTTLFGQAHEPAIQLAERLPEYADLPGYHTFLCNSGSEAVEASLKIAISYWQRKESGSRRMQILTFHNSYHGETAGAMGASGFDMHHDLYPGMPYQTIRVASPAITEEEKHRSPRHYPSLAQAVDRLDEQVAAIIVEPLHGAGGIVPVPREVLEEVQQICTQRGYLLIMDEVATGFYRAGTKFLYQETGLRPDMLVLGKGISAGYLPLSAVLLHPRIGQLFSRQKRQAPFMHGHTFSGNPLACAAALGNLDVLSQSATVAHIAHLQDCFRQVLRETLDHFADVHVRCEGLIAGIEIHDTNATRDDAKIALDACNTLKKRGILTRSMGNTIVLAPPYVSTDQDVQSCVRQTSEALTDTLKTHERD